MNRRITKMQFENYRAFYGEHTITLPKGENLLIYGENGSGKSSVFDGLSDLFRSSDVTDEVTTTFDRRRHLKATEPETSITVIFAIKDDATGITTEQTFTFGNQGNNTQQPFLVQTNALKSFLSYKNLLKTHFLKSDEFEAKFFELMVETILKNHVNLSTNKTIQQDWQDLSASPGNLALLNQFNQGLQTTLVGDPSFSPPIVGMNDELQTMLNYFHHHIQVQLIPPVLSSSHGAISGAEMKLQVHYFDMPDVSHLDILNEARLSALALSIYFASILTNRTPADYKILFLDDIFIGLDMSNRLPLLRILQDKFADYQIFLTTYDRHWFEVAKLHLKTNWQAIEMYVGQKEGVDFEFPIILAPSDDYYAKAEKYFHKKPGGEASSIDYPAAANYLRKECERLLKEKLFGKYLLKNKGKTGASDLRQELGELKDMFKKMMKDFGLDWTPFQDFDIVMKTTLNPFSHDNLEKPIYKTELAEAFRLIDALRALKRVVLLPENELIALEKTYPNGIVRKTVLKITNGGMLILKQGNVWKIPKCGLQPLHYLENGRQTDLRRLTECDLHKAYDMICHHMYAQRHASQTADIYAEFRSETTGKTLKEMADEV